MRTATLVSISLLTLAACTDEQPTKQESARIFLTANSALQKAQERAIEAAKNQARVLNDLHLDYSGSCANGGTVGVTGDYDSAGSGSRSSFDLKAEFSGCKEANGTLDGSVRWISVAETGKFSATLNGQLDFEDSSGSASCELSLSLEVTQSSVFYKGRMCGYDVGELSLGS